MLSFFFILCLAAADAVLLAWCLRIGRENRALAKWLRHSRS